jgi:hypothetical protein
MSPVELGTKNGCAGENQEQFTRLTAISLQPTGMPLFSTHSRLKADRLEHLHGKGGGEAAQTTNWSHKHPYIIQNKNSRLSNLSK